MTFEEFKIIHQLISSQIKGSEFDGISFYVGGCVRDIILNRPINDINICVAKPNGGIEFANFITKKLGIYELSVNPILHPQFGTAKFKLKQALLNFANIEINVVQTRKLINNTNNKSQEIHYGTVTEDALMRDLTINALYFNITEGECFGVCKKSTEDIKNHILRTPSDANITFSNDALRILRTIRFSSVLGWGIEPKTWIGMCVNVHKLQTISKEHIRNEFDKIITSKNGDEGIRKLYRCGALKYIIPEFEELYGLNQGRCHDQDAFEHSLKVMMKMKPAFEYRLAGLLHDIGKPQTKKIGWGGVVNFKGHEFVGGEMAYNILTSLKYPIVHIERVVKAINNHMKFKQHINPSSKSIRKFINELSCDAELDLCLDLIDADNTSHAPKYCIVGQTEFIEKSIERLSEKTDLNNVTLPVNGNDIMKKFNIKKGPKVGAALRLLTEYAHISPKMTKEDAFKVIERAIEKNEL